MEDNDKIASEEKNSLEKSNNKSFTKVFKYYLDNILAKNSNFIIYLIIFSFILGFIMTLIQYLFALDIENDSLYDEWWNSVSKILDLELENETSWKSKIISFMFWSLSIALSGVIIGFITSKINTFFTQFNKGKSNILDKNHILILGWSVNIFAILKELSIANESNKNQVVVIFADRSNEKMQEEIYSIKNDTKHLKVITRSGSPKSKKELQITNLKEAKSVLILNEDEGDSSVVITVLSVCALLSNKNTPIISSVTNDYYANALSSISEFNIIPVIPNYVIANVTTQACRKKGLGLVILDFLDFDGDEIYFKKVPELIGKTYREALLSFNKSSVIGIVENKNVSLSPNSEEIINENSELIFISEDDSAIIYTGSSIKSNSIDVINYEHDTKPMTILFVGWSKLGLEILKTLKSFLHKDSIINVLYVEDYVSSSDIKLDLGVNYYKIKNINADIENHITDNNYDEVIVLSYTDKLHNEKADTISILKTLQLDSLLKSSSSDFRIITQLIDSSKAPLMTTIEAKELIISDNLAALLMTQLVENPHLIGIFNTLFSSEGACINVFPINKYTKSVDKILYSEIVYNASFLNESVIGVLYKGNKKNINSNLVVLNPKKTREIIPEDIEVVMVISNDSQ